MIKIDDYLTRYHVMCKTCNMNFFCMTMCRVSFQKIDVNVNVIEISKIECLSDSLVD